MFNKHVTACVRHRKLHGLSCLHCFLLQQHRWNMCSYLDDYLEHIHGQNSNRHERLSTHVILYTRRSVCAAPEIDFSYRSHHILTAKEQHVRRTRGHEELLFIVNDL